MPAPLSPPVNGVRALRLQTVGVNYEEDEIRDSNAANAVLVVLTPSAA